VAAISVAAMFTYVFWFYLSRRKQDNNDLEKRLSVDSSSTASFSIHEVGLEDMELDAMGVSVSRIPSALFVYRNTY
jgi:hypothetical protein